MLEAVIFGTGALATRLGWHLARAEVEVTLVGTWGAALDAIALNGVALDMDGVLENAPAHSARLGDSVGPAPLVLVVVKSHRTAAVAAHAVRAAAPGGLVLTLQNGLGNRETLEIEAKIAESKAEEAMIGDAEATARAKDATTGAAEAVENRTLAKAPPNTVTIGVGVTSLGAMSTAPGRALTGGSGETVLGAPPDMAPSARAVLEDFADRLRSERLDVRTEPDIDVIVWRKLAVNCAINPLSAIHRALNGQLLDDIETRALMRSAAGEVAVLAAALGIHPGEPDELADLAETVARRTATNRSSMLQDIERGAFTEIDALCGAVVLRGEQAGIATPVNERLWREVREIEGRAIWPTIASGRNSNRRAGK